MPLDPNLIDRAVELARELQVRATALQTTEERRQQAELDRMLQTPDDKATLVLLTDQAFRSQRAPRVADQFSHILDVQGIPQFFSPLDHAMLRGFQVFGGWLPGVAVPMVKEHLRHETANVVLPADHKHLQPHLRARQAEGVRMNVNFLGEALLGEEEAQRRLDKYLAALQMPEVEVLSVKISTLYSQISALAREHTHRVLCDRLEPLYRAAAAARFVRADGSSVPKFVYLDMEEYRDLALTAEVFMRTLSRSGLEHVSAGIALQAYIPDSARVQRQIHAWARERVAHGGVPVTMRIVKGANMEMERVEAAQRGWPQAPYLHKWETDANYKRLLQEGLKPENRAAVKIGVASHNLFDVALALTLVVEAGAEADVQYEMLEGMANHQRRALLEKSRNLLLYAPAAHREEFLNAIGYLIRRLDENTGEENFLRHAFRLTPESDDWKLLEKGFRHACSQIDAISDEPRRSQDRNTEHFDVPRAEMPWRELVNEPDTDWSLPQNSAWAERLVTQTELVPPLIPLVVAGEERLTPMEQDGSPAHPWATCHDPSRPDVAVTQYVLAGNADVDRAVACAMSDPEGWRDAGHEHRSQVLGRVAQELRKARGRLLWAALVDGGKVLSESDPEVSEAVDFVEFYRAAAREFQELPSVETRGKGVVVVVSPWNFPIAIPCGGIAAALAAGNTVILKPSSDAVLIAWELCQCFWRAGISRYTLQFLPCSGGQEGSRLVGHDDVNAVILTGGTETAQRMLARKPGLRLCAETGGKNATIITSLSDRELAIKHVLHSAFSHSGQKCSATSLLLLEREVYEDEGFQRMFRDAVQSMVVGSAWHLETRMGPLIRPAGGDLARALTTLEEGESWLVTPHQDASNPALWSPGVKWGVQRGSFTHRTELFGPVLGVMPFDDLEEAIAIVHETGFGLTSGLHSLDDREVDQWKASIQAGNLYINRSTVGAVVLRQPFGGMAKSCFGPGMKAGGPNYVAQFMQFRERPVDLESPLDEKRLYAPNLEWLREALIDDESLDEHEMAPLPHDQLRRLLRALTSYDAAWAEEFSRQHDHFRLMGQDNIRRYLPFAQVTVRVSQDDTVFENIARVAAAKLTGAQVVISKPSPETVVWGQEWISLAGGNEFMTMVESDDQLALRLAAMPTHANERIRYARPNAVSGQIRIVASRAGVYLADEPVSAEGRVELLWYLREQSVSYDYHRYGNLGARAGEARAGVA